MFGIHFGDDRQTLVLDSGGVEDSYSGSCFSVKLLKRSKNFRLYGCFCKFIPVDFERSSNRGSHWWRTQSIVSGMFFIGARSEVNKETFIRLLIFCRTIHE